MWEKEQLQSRVLPAVWFIMVMDFWQQILIYIQWFQLAWRLAGASKDTETEVEEQIPHQQGQRSRQKRQEQRQTRWQRPRLQYRRQCSTMAAILLCAGVLGNLYAGYNGKACSVSITEGQCWHGSSPEWTTQPPQISWTGGDTGSGSLFDAEGGQQGTNYPDGIPKAGKFSACNYQAAERDQPAKAILEEVPRQDFRGVRGPENQVPGENGSSNRAIAQIRRRLRRSQENTPGCSQRARKSGPNRSSSSSSCTSPSACDTSQQVTQEEDCRGRGRSCQKTSAKCPRDFGRRAHGCRTQKTAAFLLGRYTSRKADRCIRRPRFSPITDLFGYDEDSPLHPRPFLWHGYERLQGCNATKITCHKESVPGEGGYYSETQAIYVASRMEHEVAHDDDCSMELPPASAYHEDFWDEVLEALSIPPPLVMRHFEEFHIGSNQPQALVIHKPDEEGFFPGAIEWHPVRIEDVSHQDRVRSLWDLLLRPSPDARHALESLGMEPEDYIIVETYGYFDHGDRGSRIVHVPIGSIEHWTERIRFEWRDFEANGAPVELIQPQPIGDPRHVHVLVHDFGNPEQPIIMLDIDYDQASADRRLLQPEMPMTKFSLWHQCGWPDSPDVDAAILKYNGHISTPLDRAEPQTGQRWQLLRSRADDLLSLLQQSAELKILSASNAGETFSSPTPDSDATMEQESGSSQSHGPPDQDCEEQEESSTQESDSPDEYDWDADLPHGLQRIATFRLGAEVPLMSIASMRTQEDFYNHLSALWRLQVRYIEDAIIVHPVPPFAAEQGCWPYIVEAVADRIDKVNQKLVVAQIDFHQTPISERPTSSEWSVLLLPATASRNDVLVEAEIEEYCEYTVEHRRCLLWHHNRLWPEQDGPHEIHDGDFLHIAVPPRNDAALESTAVEALEAYETAHAIGRSYSTNGEADTTLPDHGEPPEQSPRNNPNDDEVVPSDTRGPTNLYPEEVWVAMLAAYREVTEPLPVVLYGLCGETVGTGRYQIPSLNQHHLEHAAHQVWPHLAHHRKNLILVTPQPKDDDHRAVHVLVEFMNQHDQPHPRLAPVLEDLHIWKLDGSLEDIRQAVYHHSHITLAKLFHGFGQWCESDHQYYCHAWARDRPLLHDGPYLLQPGDLVTLRLSPKRPEEMAWVTERFPNAPVFYHQVVQQSATSSVTDQTWSLFLDGEDTTHAVYQPRWHGHHSPSAVLETYRTGLQAEETLEIYFVPYLYVAQQDMVFVAHPADDPNEVCYISYVVQTPGGVEDEGIRSISIPPTTSFAELLTIVGFPRWTSSTTCAITLLRDGVPVDDTGGVHFRSGNCLQLTISIADWQQLAQDLATTETTTTTTSRQEEVEVESVSLLQTGAYKRKFPLPLAPHLDLETNNHNVVQFPLKLHQVASFLGAWQRKPLNQPEEVPKEVELQSITCDALDLQDRPIHDRHTHTSSRMGLMTQPLMLWHGAL